MLRVNEVLSHIFRCHLTDLPPSLISFLLPCLLNKLVKWVLSYNPVAPKTLNLINEQFSLIMSNVSLDS